MTTTDAVLKNAKIITAKFSGRCTECGDVIPSGTRCMWVKGAGVRHNFDCNVDSEREFRSRKDRAEAPVVQQDKQVTVTMGVFKLDGRVYVVKPNREKTKVYAKEVVESAPRMTENGEVVDFELRYAAGVVFKLTEADRLDLEDAKDWLTKFARCIVCGRHLKAAKSVAGAIGPVCAKYFKGSSHVNACADHDSTAPKGAVAAAVDSIAKSPKSMSDLANAMIEDAPETPHQKRLNEAKANAHKVSQELLDHIKIENEVSRRWQAAGKDRWAGLLCEEPEHWALYGVYTLEDYKRDQALCDAKEERKASYDWEPLTDEQIKATAEINREFAEIRAQVIAERANKVRGIKASEINGKFRLAALQLRNS